LGFWPSYFAKFFNGTADFKFYFHFHATMMILWIPALVLQPILIKKKKVALHRFIGKMTYFLFPLIVTSVMLIVNLSHNHNLNEKDLGINVFGQVKDFIIFAMAYFIAIKYRHNIDVHARAMIATGIALIEPALARIFYNSFGGFKIFENLPLFGNILAIIMISLLLIALMMKERHQKKGRWVFPLILGLYTVVNAIAIFQIHITLWESFSKWFVSLPLT
jgi:Ca2+/Na+ antiporter